MDGRFRRGRKKGMALRIELGDDAQAGLDSLLVLGVCAGSPEAGAKLLSDLLDHHHFTDGLGVIPVGTPTNNLSSTQRSGWSRTAPPGHPDSFRTERGAPLIAQGDDSDGDILTGALGIDSAVLAHAEYANTVDDADMKAMNALLWPVTWGYFLDKLITPAPEAEVVEWTRQFFTDRVRAAGPLRAIRLGDQPYGVLPCLPQTRWTPGPRDTVHHTTLRDLLSVLTDQWRGALAAVDPSQRTVGRLLKQTPVSTEVKARGVFGTGWLDTALWFENVFRPELYADVDDQRQRASATEDLMRAVAAGHSFPDTFTDPTPWPKVQLAADEPTRGYLTSLAALPESPPADAPPTLLAQLAHHALRLAAAPGSQITPASLVPALEHLAKQPAPVLDRLVRQTLDLASHRLDAWTTAMATDRLAKFRSNPEHQRGLLVGGWGYVHDLRLDDDEAASEGFIHAPSIGQANAAAVLRSGYLSRQRGQEVAIDLGADRVRLATYLLDGVRDGQTLAALLGYRLERALHEYNLDSCIQPFRENYPPVDGSRTALVDGYAVAQADPTTLPFEQLLRDFPDQPEVRRQARASLTKVVEDLASALDAVSDAVLAENVYQAVQGNWARAGATVDATAGSDVLPPELEFVRTPRTGIGCTQRVLLIMEPASLDGWATTDRALADPLLNSWVGRMLGQPEKLICTVQVLDAKGEVVPTATGARLHHVSIDALGLGPLDVVRVADRLTELEDRLAVHLLNAVPDLDSVRLIGDEEVAEGNLAATVFLELARAAGALARTARALDARDFALPGASISDLDYEELTSRANNAVDALTGVGKAIDECHPDALTADQAVPLRDALHRAAAFSVRDTLVRGENTDKRALSDLSRLATSVRDEISQRLTKANMPPPAPLPVNPTTPTEIDARVRHEVERLQAVFGERIPALPRFSIDLSAATAPFKHTKEINDPAAEPSAWLTRLSHIRPALAALETVAMYAQALGDRDTLDLEVGQLPLEDSGSQSWIGLPNGESPPAGGRVALLAAGGPPRTGTEIAGLLVDEVAEVIPSARETTALTFHYDGPDAVAPRVILLAVPPNPDLARWTLDSLVDTVIETLELAQLRGVDHTMLRGTPGRTVLDQMERFLPAVFIPDKAAQEPSVPASQLGTPPPDYGQVITAKHPTITGVTYNPDPFQGRTVKITLEGEGFAPRPLPPGVEWTTKFVLPDVAVLLEPPDPDSSDTSAELTVRIRKDAPPGDWPLSVRTPMGIANSSFEVKQVQVTGIGNRDSGGPWPDWTIDQTEDVLFFDNLRVYGAGLKGASVVINKKPDVISILDTGSDNEDFIDLSLKVDGYGPPPRPNSSRIGPVSHLTITVSTPDGIQITRAAFDIVVWEWD
jgi:hypothetical protein